MNGISLYTISRCKSSTGGELYKRTHASHDGEITFCGKETTNGMWWIWNNLHDGEVTCPDCIRQWKKTK